MIEVFTRPTESSFVFDFDSIAPMALERFASQASKIRIPRFGGKPIVSFDHNAKALLISRTVNAKLGESSGFLSTTFSVSAFDVIRYISGRCEIAKEVVWYVSGDDRKLFASFRSVDQKHRNREVIRTRDGIALSKVPLN